MSFHGAPTLGNRTMNVNTDIRCIPIQVSHPDLADNFNVQLFFGSVYLIIFIIGIVGNSLVIFGMFRKTPSFNGIRLTFIGNLTFANLLVGVTSLPITSIQIFTRNWIFGGAACRIVPGLQGVSIFATSMTLAAIAIDRVRFARSVAAHRMSRVSTGSQNMSRDWYFVVPSWIVSILFSVPYVVFLRTIRNPISYQEGTIMLNNTTVKHYAENTTICGDFCEEFWPKPQSIYKPAYGLFVLTIQFITPGFICFVCYMTVYKKVLRQSRFRAINERLSLQTLQRLRYRKNRVLRMSILMVTSFFVSWLPVNFMNLARDFGYTSLLPSREYYTVVFAIAHVAAMTSIIWNPIIYFFCNDNYRSLLGPIFSQTEMDGGKSFMRRISGRTASNVGFRLTSTVMEMSRYSRRQRTAPQLQNGSAQNGTDSGILLESEHDQVRWFIVTDGSTCDHADEMV